ncbi:MAG: DUF3857 domain-containing protein [Cytophagales bacterium]|nr:DUF3857 domain-containing protein [Cytophagales bacterium]
MKHCRALIFIFFLVTSQFCFADNLFYLNYNWESEPEFETQLAEASRQNAIILKDLKAIEFFFDEDYDALLQLYTVHSKIHVNTHEAVEMYNKHYMPMSRVLDIVDLRARVITKEETKEIERIDLKDYEGEDEYSSYKYFAIEGVEVGSQIEYIYTFKMSPQLEGGREFFQSDELKLNAEFHLLCEDKMFFNTKSYNGFKELKLDTTISGKNHYYARLPRIEPLKPELYAPYNNSLMRVEYKLDYIMPAEKVKLYTYDQISNQLYQYFGAELSKKDVKSLKKLSRNLGLGQLSGLEKIRKIESYIKRNITISDQDDVESGNLELVLEELVTNQKGVVKLYASLLDLHGINYRYGLTSDRTRVNMDPNFESYSFLENYFFYFPDYDTYMAPTEVLYRVGYIPFNWSNNYGLFIKPLKNGALKTGVGEVKFIEPLSYDKNQDKLDIKIDFGKQFESLNLDIKRTLTGYNATFIQPIFELIPEAETKLVVNELLNLSGRDVDLQYYNLINSSLDSFYLKPFIIHGKVSTKSSYFDKAGNRYLLKIGEVIGEQIEMYQEEERKLPVENEFNRKYERKIQFEIPEGYRVRNLEDLRMNIFYQQNGENSMGFISDYTVEGNTVMVSIREYYKELDYPIELFDQFRNIINAAADFNKKVLIFEKV